MSVFVSGLASSKAHEKVYTPNAYIYILQDQSMPLLISLIGSHSNAVVILCGGYMWWFLCYVTIKQYLDMNI